jgi:type IV secretory pathway VirB10-like protein
MDYYSYQVVYVRFIGAQTIRNQSRLRRSMRVAPIVGLAFALLIAGCSGVKPAPSSSQPPNAAEAAAPPATASQTAVKPVPPPAKGPSAAAPKAAVAEPPKKESPAPDAAKKASPTLDLKSLEQRLKDTEAIGVLTKIALKNQVDDLLDQFRAFYQGKLKTTLAELRRSYDLLVLKVLSLLQDSDPSLATAIVTSREAIWGILADRAKFSTI